MRIPPISSIEPRWLRRTALVVLLIPALAGGILYSLALDLIEVAQGTPGIVRGVWAK